MYTKFLITVITLLSLIAVAYTKVAQPVTMEPFAGIVGFPSGFTGSVQPTIPTETGCVDIYTPSMNNHPYEGQTLVVGTDVSTQAPHYNDDPAFKAQMEKNTEIAKEQGGATNPYFNRYESKEGLTNPGCVSEGYTGPDSFYTVPGTFQSEIAPRFQNTDFGAQINYNFPEADHLAAYPDNPLTLPTSSNNDSVYDLADQVETFEQQHQERYEDTKTKFAQVHEPIALPKTMDGPVREGMMGGKGGKHDKGGKHTGKGHQGKSSDVAQFHVADRLVMAIARSPCWGNGDAIRGDLPIIPDPGLCGWFRPHQAAQPVSCLRSGALAVMGGAYGAQQAMDKMRTMETTDTTSAGVQIPPGNQSFQTYQAEQMSVGSNGDVGVNGQYSVTEGGWA